MRATSMGAAMLLSFMGADAKAVSCSIEQVTIVAFGNYEPTSPSPKDSTGGITFRCQSPSGVGTILIRLNPGLGPSYDPRRMKSGSNSLFYNLYLDAARTIIWGDGTPPTSYYGPVAPPNNISVTVPVYGRIPALQPASTGSYSDQVIVTLVY